MKIVLKKQQLFANTICGVEQRRRRRREVSATVCCVVFVGVRVGGRAPGAGEQSDKMVAVRSCCFRKETIREDRNI